MWPHIVSVRLSITRVLRKAWMALNTRYLFNNWFLLLFKYILLSLGLDTKLRAVIDTCIVELNSQTFARLVSGFSRGLIKSVKCIDRGFLVNDVELEDINEVAYTEMWARVLGWRFSNEYSCWVKDGVKFKNMYWSILEVFDYKEYNALNVNDKAVVDIGAFTGDSSIYFALRGARRVIAIEPDLEAYRELLENVKLNNLEDIIIPVNAILVSSSSKPYVKSLHGKISMITLGEVVSKYRIDDNAVLKMDCEGCEHDIILRDYENVRIFGELIFEYHVSKDKPLSKLLQILSRDYRCRITYNGKTLGVVYCTRK